MYGNAPRKENNPPFGDLEIYAGAKNVEEKAVSTAILWLIPYKIGENNYMFISVREID